MSLVSELRTLQELPTPEMPSYWPQTWGWGALLALALMLALAALIRWKRRRDTNAYRRAALADLGRIEALWRNNPDNPTPLRDIPGLLKQAVMQRPTRDTGASQHIASQSGAAWQALLSELATRPLPARFSDELATLAYAPDPEVMALGLPDLIAECRHWLETHHAPV